MLYYFAGAYERRAELAEYRTRLIRAIGSHNTVAVSRWLDQDQEDSTDAGFSVEMLHVESVATKAWAYGLRDLEDLTRCDAIVSFTGQGARGGRHVEHGVALAMWAGTEELAGGDMRLIVVGPREHVFHCHPATEVFPDFEAFLTHETERVTA